MQKPFTLLQQVRWIRLARDLIFLRQNRGVAVHEIAHEICPLLRGQKPKKEKEKKHPKSQDVHCARSQIPSPSLFLADASGLGLVGEESGESFPAPSRCLPSSVGDDSACVTRSRRLGTRHQLAKSDRLCDIGQVTRPPYMLL